MAIWLAGWPVVGTPSARRTIGIATLVLILINLLFKPAVNIPYWGILNPDYLLLGVIPVSWILIGAIVLMINWTKNNAYTFR